MFTPVLQRTPDDGGARTRLLAGARDLIRNISMTGHGETIRDGPVPGNNDNRKHSWKDYWRTRVSPPGIRLFDSNTVEEIGGMYS